MRRSNATVSRALANRVAILSGVSDPTEAVHELLDRAQALSFGAERVERVEEAVRLADRHSDLELGFAARDELISAATFSGYPEKALVAFTWCLAQCDREPERFQDRHLLWKYKWVAAHLPYFPQIPKAKIAQVHDDMEARYRKAGQSLQPVFTIRWQAALDMGEGEAARAHYAEAERHERDVGSDCAACVISDRVRHLLFEEQPEAALEAADPILSGRSSCAEIPHATLAMLLLPLLRLGRQAEALRAHRWGYRLIRGNRDFVEAVGAHIEFLTLTGNLELARSAFEEHATHALEVSDIDDRFHFFKGASVLLTRLEREGADLSRLRLPTGFGLTTPTTATLRAFVLDLTRDLARQFDARNGNDSYADDLAAALARLDDEAVDWPLEERS